MKTPKLPAKSVNLKNTAKGAPGLKAGKLKGIALGSVPAGAKIRSRDYDSPEPYKPPDEHNVSMRPINNGYVIRQHGYADGKRFEHEHFSPTKPTLQFEQAKREARLSGKTI